MTEAKVTRRLAAILAADMVGYSRLTGADEVGTIARQRTVYAEVIDPAIAGHGGRIVKTTGDGLLAEFPSVVDAVACAHESAIKLFEKALRLDPQYDLALQFLGRAQFGLHRYEASEASFKRRLIYKPGSDVTRRGSITSPKAWKKPTCLDSHRAARSRGRK